MEYGDFADLMFRGVQDIGAIEGTDRPRIFSYFHRFVRTYANAHYRAHLEAAVVDQFNTRPAARGRPAISNIAVGPGHSAR